MATLLARWALRAFFACNCDLLCGLGNCIYRSSKVCPCAPKFQMDKENRKQDAERKDRIKKEFDARQRAEKDEVIRYVCERTCGGERGMFGLHDLEIVSMGASHMRFTCDLPVFSFWSRVCIKSIRTPAPTTILHFWCSG